MGERLLFLGVSPERAHLIVKQRLISEPRVQVAALRSGLPHAAAVGIRVDDAALTPTTSPGTYWVDRGAAEKGITRAYQPWHVDVNAEHRDRWAGYLDPDFTMTLRNHHAAVTPGELRRAEDLIVRARLIELSARPVEQTLDLAHLRDVHARLFSDVYPWAGEVRTVDMRRAEGPLFASWDEIEVRWDLLANQVHSRDLLRGLDSDSFAREAAGVYNEVNKIHAFREGNGRTQREWMNDLASAAGHDIHWSLVAGATNDRASQLAREGHPEGLIEMFRIIVAPRTVQEAAAAAGPVTARAGREAPATAPSLPLESAAIARAMFGTPARAAVRIGKDGTSKAVGRSPSTEPESGMER